MLHQAPAGARDLLPLEVAQKSWINDRLQQVFQNWGYKRIVTSSIQWLDTLMAGGAIKPSTVIPLQNIGKGNLALRPELTASIARAAVTRMQGDAVQRLCYRANVFRNSAEGHHGKQLEFYQAGVELLFADGLLADGETLLLVAHCLESLAMEDWQLLLGDAGLTKGLLGQFPPEVRGDILNCLANLDRIALEGLKLDEDLKVKALQLFELRGNPEEVLAQISTFELDEETTRALNHLKGLLELVNHSYGKPLPIVLDLSLVQTFDYYTGIVFEVVGFSDSQPRVLGQGGRYDQLLGLYHPQKQDYPGIGFSFNIEDLHSCLLSGADLPKTTPPSDWLVIPESPDGAKMAFDYAQRLRHSENIVRVELELQYRSEAQIRAYAQDEGIKHLAWIGVDGTPKIEVI
ncbi:MAG: ATP phosphoribosyltransferase regulatory subunit [Cyanobacterium sp.]